MDTPQKPKRRIHWTLWGVLLGLAVLFSGVIFTALTASYGPSGKVWKAQLGCTSIEQAIEAYIDHPDNPKHEFPRTLDDLVSPPFGGPPFLRNGANDLLDPWGQSYQTERVRHADGSECILVKTTAPDGTPISVFGIGPNAQPRQ